MGRTGPVVPGRRGRWLSLLSVAGFWVLPLSPLLAIAALSSTRGAPGWPARTARAGAWLTAAWTAVMTTLFVWACLDLWFV